jgi:putative oxidoreductase
VQRLFSSFADGCPGTGLLIQRLLIGAILLHRSFLQPSASPHFTTFVLPLIASVLLVIGLGTPYIGLLVAAAQLWLLFWGAADPWTAMVVCALGISLAMIGPGAWSMDARFFGRKHIEVIKR